MAIQTLPAAPTVSTTTAKPQSNGAVSSSSSSQPFLDMMAARRSIYLLGSTSPIPASRISNIISQAIQHVPSSFNTQTTRIVLLLGAQHRALWQATKDILRARLSAEVYPTTDAKLSMFQGAFATVLFFDDMDVVAATQANIPSYADKFEAWARESNAMHQFAVWTALEAEGLGANLQHYNPLIDERVQELWGVSKAWALRSQLVIGEPVGDAKPMEKSFLPVDGRFKVFGA